MKQVRRVLSMAGILFVPLLSYAQNQISGTVSDANNNPLAGATVYLAETYEGTSTNGAGEYKIPKLKNGSYEVIYSFVGYQNDTITIEINGSDVEQNVSLEESNTTMSEHIVQGTRVDNNAPFAHENIDAEEYEENNLGQDLPYMLQTQPSMVTTSDAGAGVGYTGFRIRGSDATRINVTVNGIPINDAESQGTFWVNMPDFASSIGDIQIQRGVGSSTNGSAAFGATVNLNTKDVNAKPYGEIANSYGSFNTRKHTFKVGTGLINDHWAFDGRLSLIRSDGYIDRATSDLRSYYLSGGYYGDKTSVKFITFSGKERTYQSWWGTPESRINNDVEAMEEYAATEGLNAEQRENLLNSGRTYNHYLYQNEVDNYKQDHYQLHVAHQFNNAWSLTAGLHYTRGKGYYEQFKSDAFLPDYGLDGVDVYHNTIEVSDLILRRWLDNHFYGGVYNVNYHKKNLNITLGGGYNYYDGDHYGEVIWAEYAQNIPMETRYYNNYGRKGDFNTYLKVDYTFFDKLTVFGDAQVRHITYATKGIDSDQRMIDIDTSFFFFNPKLGLNYQINNTYRVYASASVAHREPVRNDFIDAPAGRNPKPERLIDYELGAEARWKKARVLINGYYMDYKDQLVLTGELNDVGSSVRTNVDQSYRAGVELIMGFRFTDWLRWELNGTYSVNKIKNFTEIVYDYTNGFDIIENEYTNTDISFSPSIIAGSDIFITPFKGFEIQIQSKFVGRQYLDNTQDINRSIDPYFYSNARVSYTFKTKVVKEIMLSFLVNNFTDTKFSSNGYTYTYIYGEQYVRNHYYPQAGINFLGGVTFKF